MHVPPKASDVLLIIIRQFSPLIVMVCFDASESEDSAQFVPHRVATCISLFGIGGAALCALRMPIALHELLLTLIHHE